jgi:F-type H+-transporting ATPase subunit b
MDLKFVTVETFVIQFIILLFVLWVLNKFLFKPYLAYLDKWEDNQKKLEEDYKNIDKLVKEAEDKKEAILAEARSKSENIISEAEDLAKQKRESIIEKAENEAKSIVES